MHTIFIVFQLKLINLRAQQCITNERNKEIILTEIF